MICECALDYTNSLYNLNSSLSVGAVNHYINLETNHFLKADKAGRPTQERGVSSPKM